jgi:O-antigen/teichoic acid export membrane protein
MVDYGKKMFYNSVIAFISGQALSFIISIKLPTEDVGAYNILLTLTGLTTFLLINLNKVFAPAISKLYHENKISELNELYKKTTFFINLFTIPLAVIITIFADEILGLYTAEMLNYKKYLFFMLAGGMLSLAAGSSGTFMVMAGLEKQNLHIQIVRAVLLIVLSLILIPILGLFSVVILYVIFMLFVNLSQLIYISKYINISPFSKELILLFSLTILGMYFAISQQFNFEIYHYFIIPIGVYVTYFSIMYYPFKKLIKELL